MKVLRADLRLAGIADVDAKGLYADFHALRGSLNTMMLSAGIPLRIAQTHMRHKDPRLTASTYTDENLLPVAAALTSLPGIPGGGLGATGTTDAADPQQIHQQSPRETAQSGANQREERVHSKSCAVEPEAIASSTDSEDMRRSAEGCEKAGDGIRTHDIHVGNVTLYH